MQNLDVISVNLWQILISLINLILLFLILKKFLYQPVKNMIAKRQNEIDSRYDSAHLAEENAKESQKKWEEQLSGAKAQADAILSAAAERARLREKTIVEDARKEAEGLIRAAQNEAELERKRASDDIKKEIISVSGVLTEKLLEREINSNDHKVLIDSFIDSIGESNE